MRTKEEFTDYLYTEVGICGCGDPESAAQLTWDILDSLVAPPGDGKTINPRPKWEAMQKKLGMETDNRGIFYLVMGRLDQLNLIEHGCSIHWPWLSLKGKDLLEEFKAYGVGVFDD